MSFFLSLSLSGFLTRRGFGGVFVCCLADRGKGAIAGARAALRIESGGESVAGRRGEGGAGDEDEPKGGEEREEEEEGERGKNSPQKTHHCRNEPARRLLSIRR